MFRYQANLRKSTLQRRRQAKQKLQRLPVSSPRCQHVYSSFPAQLTLFSFTLIDIHQWKLWHMPDPQNRFSNLLVDHDFSNMNIFVPDVCDGDGVLIHPGEHGLKLKTSMVVTVEVTLKMSVTVRTNHMQLTLHPFTGGTLHQGSNEIPCNRLHGVQGKMAMVQGSINSFSIPCRSFPTRISANSSSSTS